MGITVLPLLRGDCSKLDKGGMDDGSHRWQQWKSQEMVDLENILEVELIEVLVI